MGILLSFPQYKNINYIYQYAERDFKQRIAAEKREKSLVDIQDRQDIRLEHRDFNNANKVEAIQKIVTIIHQQRNNIKLSRLNRRRKEFG